MAGRRPRGRPRGSRSNAELDDVIGRTVHQLSGWGYSIRREAAPAVAVAIAAQRGRVDGRGKPLGDDRIEQIFKAWRRGKHRPSVDTASGEPFFRPPRGYGEFRVDELRAMRPHRHMRGMKDPLPSLAATLVRHGGEWPYPLPTNWAAWGAPGRTGEGTAAVDRHLPSPADVVRDVMLLRLNIAAINAIKTGVLSCEAADSIIATLTAATEAANRAAEAGPGILIPDWRTPRPDEDETG